VGAFVGNPYSTTLTAVGGLPPYHWFLNSGSLPSGLSLSNSGIISGTPTDTENGDVTSWPFSVRVSDSNSNDMPAFGNFELDLYGPPHGCPTKPVQQDSCSGTASIYGPYPDQGAAGTQQTLSIFSDCFGYDSWNSVTLNLPPGFTEVGSPTVTWSGLNAATITAVVNISQGAHVGQNPISATLSGSGCQWPTNSVSYNVTPFCPWSVSLASTIQEPLRDLFPAMETGIGIAVVMDADPSYLYWNGAQIAETLITQWDSCPTPPYPQGMGNLCSGGE